MDTNMTFNIDKRNDCIQQYIYFDCSFHSLSRLSGRFNLVVYRIWALCVRACVHAKFDAWKEGAASTEVRRDARRVPRSHAREKKGVFRLGEKLVAPLIAVLYVDSTNERHKKRQTQRTVSSYDTSLCPCSRYLTVILCAIKGARKNYLANTINSRDTCYCTT